MDRSCFRDIGSSPRRSIAGHWLKNLGYCRQYIRGASPIQRLVLTGGLIEVPRDVDDQFHVALEQRCYCFIRLSFRALNRRRLLGDAVIWYSSDLAILLP